MNKYCLLALVLLFSSRVNAGLISVSATTNFFGYEAVIDFSYDDDPSLGTGLSSPITSAFLNVGGISYTADTAFTNVVNNGNANISGGDATTAVIRDFVSIGGVFNTPQLIEGREVSNFILSLFDIVPTLSGSTPQTLNDNNRATASELLDFPVASDPQIASTNLFSITPGGGWQTSFYLPNEQNRFLFSPIIEATINNQRVLPSTSVPEPTTLAIFGLGLILLLRRRYPNNHHILDAISRSSSPTASM